MKKPTGEQQCEFWEWCGLFWGWSTDWSKPPGREAYGAWFVKLQPPTACAEVSRELPPIDLNNLFGYAVPKFNWFGKALLLNEWIADVLENNPDPALALFWAIYEVMKDDNAGNAD